MNKEFIMNEWQKIANYVKVNYANIFDKDVKISFEKKSLSKKLFCITPEGNCYIEYVSRGNGYTCYAYYFHPEKDIKCLDYEERKLQAADKVISCWEEIKKNISNKESDVKKPLNFEAEEKEKNQCIIYNCPECEDRDCNLNICGLCHDLKTMICGVPDGTYSCNKAVIDFVRNDYVIIA